MPMLWAMANWIQFISLIRTVHCNRTALTVWRTNGLSCGVTPPKLVNCQHRQRFLWSVANNSFLNWSWLLLWPLFWLCKCRGLSDSAKWSYHWYVALHDKVYRRMSLSLWWMSSDKLLLIAFRRSVKQHNWITTLHWVGCNDWSSVAAQSVFCSDDKPVAHFAYYTVLSSEYCALCHVDVMSASRLF